MRPRQNDLWKKLFGESRSPVHAPRPSSTPDLPAGTEPVRGGARKLLLKAINAARAKHGVAPFYDEELELDVGGVCRTHTVNMSREGRMSHDGLDREQLVSREFGNMEVNVGMQVRSQWSRKLRSGQKHDLVNAIVANWLSNPDDKEVLLMTKKPGHCIGLALYQKLSEEPQTSGDSAFFCTMIIARDTNPTRIARREQRITQANLVTRLEPRKRRGKGRPGHMVID